MQRDRKTSWLAVWGCAAIVVGQLLASRSSAQQVINEELIVQGSTCIGLACAADETFSGGFDTLLLKENNLRIRFYDDSASGTFPTNDWQLVANDATSGGAEYFAIEDATHSRTPFKVLASAPNNSLLIDSTGEVGFGTSDPQLELHVLSGDTPGLRFEQTNTSGFSAQTWDIFGNEVGFAVRDLTAGSKLPFRIRPGASSSSLVIAASSNVGIGTLDPENTLEIERSALVSLGLSDTRGTGASFELIAGDNGDGVGAFRIQKRSDPDVSFKLASNGSVYFGGNEGFAWNAQTKDITSAGNIQIAGVFNGSSSRSVKQSIEPIDTGDVLEKVAKLSVAKWSYIREGDGVRHLGPMAEDFHAAFGLGGDDKHIGVLDAVGVSMAAIQGLQSQLQSKEQRIHDLEKKNADLEARLSAIEAALGAGIRKAATTNGELTGERGL